MSLANKVHKPGSQCSRGKHHGVNKRNNSILFRLFGDHGMAHLTVTATTHKQQQVVILAFDFTRRCGTPASFFSQFVFQPVCKQISRIFYKLKQVVATPACLQLILANYLAGYGA
jgi:hypothetical protein